MSRRARGSHRPRRLSPPGLPRPPARPPRSPPPPPPSSLALCHPLSVLGAGDPTPVRLAPALLRLPFFLGLRKTTGKGRGGRGGTSRSPQAAPEPLRSALLAPSRERHMGRHEPGERTGPAQDRESGWAGGAPLPGALAPTPALVDAL